MVFYSAKPLYMYPFRFLLNKDIYQLIFVFVLIWKLYYYFTGNNISKWDVANSSYKTANYIFETINSIINTFIIIMLAAFLIIFKNK